MHSEVESLVLERLMCTELLLGKRTQLLRTSRLRRLLFMTLTTLAWARGAAVEAEVLAGQVVSSGRRPVEHARIVVTGIREAKFSDREGRFEITDVELPATLTIGHPRFEITTHEVSVAAADLVIVLVAKQEVYETIAVSANRGEQNFAPVSIAASVIEPEEAAAPAANVSQLVAETAAVSENGQGGAFQTFSIRGVSRQRVMTLVTGMRIVGERRAGVSASFFDPLLLGSVDVVRGPSSTYYGSGALGGVVQLFPRRFERLTVATGFETRGEESSLLLAGGNESTSWGLASRDAGNSETPGGDDLYTQYRLHSGSFHRLWERGNLGMEVNVLGSLASDVGKANTDFPVRITTYPEESHLIARLGIERPAVWEFEAAVHPNRLETRVLEEGIAESRLENDSLDVSMSWQRRILGPKVGALRLGADYFGRRGVEARERLIDLSGEQPLEVVQNTLDAGEEDEFGLFGAGEWNRGPAVVIAGGRLAWQRQRNSGVGSAEDQALTAFTGVVIPVGGGFELAANAGTGLRFPSLSERFFSGTTGRGFVVGNRDLESERSFNLDLGLRFYGERLFVAGYLFRNEIDDYIERVEIEPERLTFVNVSSGRIEGIEAEGLLQLATGWSLTFGGHAFDGRDGDDLPLADVPADRFYLGTELQRDHWDWRLRWEGRAKKADPGSGEKVIPAADLVSGSLGLEVRPGMKLRAAVRNALDDEYFNAADRKVPLAPGRSFSLSLRWSKGDE
jgi:iron complex outermembrane receptor protein